MPDIDAWIALIAPKGLPPDVAQKLRAATTKALAKPDVQAKLGTLGFAPAPLGPDKMGNFIKSEVEKWAKLVKARGFEPGRSPAGAQAAAETRPELT